MIIIKELITHVIDGTPQEAYIVSFRPKNDEETIATVPAVINNKRVVLSRYAFEYVELKEILVPKGVILSEHSFSNAKIKKIRIEEPAIIPEDCFSFCCAEEIVLTGNQCCSIGSSAFSYCKNLRAFVWPTSCKTIPESCFTASNLSSIKGIEDVTKVEEYAFSSTSIKSIIWPSGCKNIPEGCFVHSNLEIIENISDVDRIDPMAFAQCENLKLFKWPKNCARIPDGCFSHSNLTSISGIENVEEIEHIAFRGTKLEEIKPLKAWYIDFTAFYDTEVCEITIKSDKVFLNNTNFRDIDIDCTACSEVALGINCNRNRLQVGFDTEIVVVEESI